MSEHVFKLPDLGEGTVEAEIAEWMVKVGDSVSEEQPICAMLTDKAAVELTAPVSGTVTSVAGDEGDMVSVGAPLIVFSTDGAAAIPANQEQPAEEFPADTATSGKVLTSPSIRARAREQGIDLSQVPGSGPKGRILKADIESFAKTPTDQAAAGKAAGKRTGATEIKVIGLRRKIAERVAQSSQEIPHFTYVEEVDVSQLETLRAHLNSKRVQDQSSLTPLPMIGMALIRALRAFPQCNALYDKDRNVIVQHEAVHLGVATQTPDGLKVPVVRHAEAMALEQLAEEIRRVTAAARDNSAAREELSGSTITVTSLGKLGGVVSTPVINQPEVGIIGINRAVERPMVVNGQVQVRTMMNLSSSFDHRFVDGYDAAAMIQLVKDYLEQPATMFMP